MCTCTCACVSSRGRGGDAGVRAHLRAHGASLYFSGLVQEHRRGGSNLTLVFQSNRAQWAPDFSLVSWRGAGFSHRMQR